MGNCSVICEREQSFHVEIEENLEQGGSQSSNCFQDDATVSTEAMLADPIDTTGLSGTVLPPESAKGSAVRSTQVQRERAISELRRCLTDLLGPEGEAQGDLPDADAIATVNAFGGEECCFRRFLLATRMNVSMANVKLRKTIQWRKEVRANEVLKDPSFQAVWDLMLPLWPERLVAQTSQGNPLTYFDILKGISTCQTKIWTDSNVQMFYVTWMELSLQLQRRGREKCGPQGDCDNMPATVVVYNMKDLHLGHVVTAALGLRSFGKILAIIDEHYPENLHKAYIINAPFVFYKVIWPMVRRALDTRTVANIHISADSSTEHLKAELGLGELEVEALMTKLAVNDVWPQLLAHGEEKAKRGSALR